MEHKRKQFASEGSERMFVTGKTSFETVMVKPKLDPLNRLAFFLVVRNESIEWNENLAKASKYVFYSRRYFHLLRNAVMSTRMSPFAKQFLSGKATDKWLKTIYKIWRLPTITCNPCHHLCRLLHFFSTITCQSLPLLPSSFTSCFLLQYIFFIEITCKIC